MSYFESNATLFNPEDLSKDEEEFFYYNKPKLIQKCILEKHKKHSFKSHIIVCIFSNEDSNPLCLRNFILPLRNKNLLVDELKPIVLTGKLKVIMKDWETICRFPEIYILEVNLKY